MGCFTLIRTTKADPMTLPAILITFAMWWWLVFFIMLPWRVEDQAPRPSQPGNVTGAPANPLLGKKIAISTLAALVLTALTYIAVSSHLYSFWDAVRHQGI